MKVKKSSDKEDIKRKEHKKIVKRKKLREEIWFDNIDEVLIDEENEDYVAVDCEMVGAGPNGNISILARVSLVNHLGKILYDEYVQPTLEITDYRTEVSGIRPKNIMEKFGALEKNKVINDVKKIFRYDTKNPVYLIGHAIDHDLSQLDLKYPFDRIRDTQKSEVLRNKLPKKVYGNIALRHFADKLLNMDDFQLNEHNSVEDARVAMKLYMLHRQEWEENIETRKMRKLQKKKLKEEQDKKDRYANMDLVTVGKRKQLRIPDEIKTEEKSSLKTSGGIRINIKK
ncbi:hypothetical protein SNEBB_001014 [Seison nebaliae]|nr:hypothetical protein SNEBB_001014 [Seison nebaliae]